VTAVHGGELWVGDARVLRDLAEQVLTVDQLQGSPPQRREHDSSLRELDLLAFRDPADDVFVRPAVTSVEALGDPLAGARAGRHEVHLAERKVWAVVQVNR